MKNLILAACLAFLLPSFCLAQDVQPQAKIAWHGTDAISQRVFLAGWVIDYAKQTVPDSLNIIGGVGVKGQSWSLENMVWRQISPAGNQWALDFRFFKTYKSGSLYVEVGPYLTKRATYQAVIAERRIVGRLSAGGEMENVHQPGKDSVGGGPRVSLLLAKTTHYKLVTSYSYQWRRTGPDWSRLYLILTTSR